MEDLPIPTDCTDLLYASMRRTDCGEERSPFDKFFAGPEVHIRWWYACLSFRLEDIEGKEFEIKEKAQGLEQANAEMTAARNQGVSVAEPTSQVKYLKQNMNVLCLTSQLTDLKQTVDILCQLRDKAMQSFIQITRTIMHGRRQVQDWMNDSAIADHPLQAKMEEWLDDFQMLSIRLKGEYYALAESMP